jgi:methionyl-tRNA formyltransferase
MNKLKIGYFADGPWSHEAFDRIILDNSLQILFIVPRFDSKDTKLEELASLHGIDFIKSSNINNKDFIESVKKYDCDIFVSLSFNQIFKNEIINFPPLKTINVHCGKLPFYRGRNILNWAIINDEREFGITVHYVDEGIDTGDIISQKVFPITDMDTYNTLLNKAFTGCAEILYDTLKVVQTGNFKTISQKTIHPVGFYCGIRGEGDENINWNQTSRQIFNFIRAVSNPGPRATTFFMGEVVKINASKIIQNAPSYIGRPGQIIGKNDSGHFIVKTLDSFIEIFDIETSCKLKIGNNLA